MKSIKWKTPKSNVSEYKFLDRYGEIGEYMRLELKCYCATSLQDSSAHGIPGSRRFHLYPEFYQKRHDGQGMKNFIMVYNFVIFGILFLSSLMSYEGNYIDGLMSRKESICHIAPRQIYSIQHRHTHTSNLDDTGYGNR